MDGEAGLGRAEAGPPRRRLEHWSWHKMVVFTVIQAEVMCIQPESVWVVFKIKSGLSTLTSQIKFPKKNFIAQLLRALSNNCR